jgi:hypothetical protein
MERHRNSMFLVTENNNLEPIDLKECSDCFGWEACSKLLTGEFNLFDVEKEKLKNHHLINYCFSYDSLITLFFEEKHGHRI